jgi:prenyl protein peptidase
MIPSPALASGSANLICVGFTLIYVVGFYIFKTPGHRDDPQVIKARIKAVTVASMVSACIVWYNLQLLQTKESLVEILGLPLSIDNVCRTLLLTCLLFLGPLTVMFFDQELLFQEHFDFERDIKWMFTTLEGLRNYIMVKTYSCIMELNNE